jgi:hypothetical protein
VFGAKYNLVLFVLIRFFFSVLAPTQGVMSKAQRRAFGGDSIFVLSPPNAEGEARGLIRVASTLLFCLSLSLRSQQVLS